jgi:hypothetical protein
MNWIAKIIPGKQAHRVVASRSFVLMTMVLLLVPQFACQCADGHVSLYCIPGKCGGGCVSAVVKPRSCCNPRPCCQRQNRREQGREDGSDLCIKKIPCCKLVVTSSGPRTAPTTFDVLLPNAAIPFMIERPLDFGCIRGQQWRNRPFDSMHPPDDIIIKQLRLTI